MRFSNPAEVVAWADKAAKGDHVCHLIVHLDEDGTPWQTSANPYSTPHMRMDWQRGYDNSPPHSWEGTREYDTAFQRGAAYRRLEGQYAAE